MKRKFCKRCGEHKFIDQFVSDACRADGRSFYCSSCRSDMKSGGGIKTSAISSSKLRYGDKVPAYGSADFRSAGELIYGVTSLRTGLVDRHHHEPAPAQKVELKSPIECPCCKQPVSVPTLEIIVDHYGLTPLEARVLGAIWRGRGMPVMTERVFDAMYIDDPDGGPTPSKMYLAFKVALCHLRKKIEGSGVDVVNVGYRRGYRLSIGGN